MAWASSGGYPGVTSDSNNGLFIVGDVSAQNWRGGPDGFVLINNSNGAPVGELQADEGGFYSWLRGALGFFGSRPPTAAIVGGAHTAGGTYTAVEQAMLNAAYTALRSIGLVT